MIAYETRLNQDRRWALREGSMHFERESAVYKSLEKIVRRLEGLGVPLSLRLSVREQWREPSSELPLLLPR